MIWQVLPSGRLIPLTPTETALEVVSDLRASLREIRSELHSACAESRGLVWQSRQQTRALTHSRGAPFDPDFGLDG
jgi:hypothetical protein